jgi:two-component system, LuxR family, sensor kinase FixL
MPCAAARKNGACWPPPVRNLAEGVIITDADLEPPGPRILFANDAVRRITGYEVGELLGCSPRVLQGRQTDRATLKRLKAALSEGRTFVGEFINYRKDKTPYHVEVLISPVRDEKNRITHYVAAHRDVTDLKRAEERAVQAARLAAIGQMVTGLAHESRNALQRSQACLEMLALELEDRPDLLNLVARVQRAQDDLHRLYEEVRDYASPRKLQREPCDIAQLWRDTWSHLKHQHEGKRLRLREQLGCSHRLCHVDPFALGQVFRNVLENAVAAAPPTRKSPSNAATPGWATPPPCRSPSPTKGRGIPPDVRTRVFEPFYTTKTKGTGLGMAIAKRIVNEHGGDITVGEHAGVGAEILITLPRDPYD